jgi:pimeloyl-ACP methyl ester carboxylesterase
LLFQRRRPEELTVPTHLLFGEADFAMSSAVLRASAANAPHIEVQIVDGGHLLAEDRPDLVALAIGHNNALVTGVDE